jgi:hypothetical protein
MPGENLQPKVAALMAELASVSSRLRQAETLLEQFRPTFLQIKDINGKLNRYQVLARPNGTATDLQFGFPFEIKDVSENDTPRVTVYRHSTLRRSLKADDQLPITGLDAPGSAAGFTVGDGEIIWLDITVSDGEATEANIDNGSGGWPDFPEPVKFEGEDADKKQTHAYLAIAQVVPYNADDRFGAPGIELPQGLMVRQHVSTHLLLRDVCYDGRAIIYPFPFAGPTAEE